MALLDRIGQGLISFGSGVPQSQIDTIRANRDVAQQNVQLNNQTIAANDAEIQKQKDIQQLSAIATGGGPDADKALTRLFSIAPELGDQIFEGIGARSQAQREDAARRALEIQSVPFGPARDAIINRQVVDMDAQTRDSSDTAGLLGQSEEDQNNALRFIQAAALSAKERVGPKAGTPLKIVDPNTGKITFVSPQDAIGQEAGFGSSKPEVVLTDNAIELAARNFNQSGKIAAGLSRAPDQIARILEKADELQRASGKTAAQVLDEQQQFRANETSLKALEKQRTLVGAFEKTALKNMDLAVELGTKVGRTGSPIVNKGLISFKQNITGDPDTASFVNALIASRTEYAKVLSGATGAAGITDSARREAEELFNKATSQKTLEAVVKTAKREMKNRLDSFEEQKKDFQVGGRKVDFGSVNNESNQVLQEARDAILQGASRDAVIQQLESEGFDSSKL